MSVIVMPRLDPAERLHTVAPEGASLAEIVAQVAPAAPVEWVRVTIGTDVVPLEQWRVVRPKEGAQVVVRVLPGDSGALRAVLMVTVAIAALSISGGLLGSAVPALGGVLGPSTLGAKIAAGAVLAGGSLLVNALVPVRSSSSGEGQDSPTYSISGLQNQLNAGGAVPRLLGEMRWAPVYAAKPWTEAIGNNRYVTALFCCGYGPLELPIEEMRIGSTPISQFKGITVEVREGYATDEPVTLYPEQVLEETLSIRLQAATSEVRTTAADVTRAAVDISFAQGLFGILKDENGTQIAMVISFRLRYRLLGTETWHEETFTIQDKYTQPLVRTYSVTFPERGQYEIELRRTSPNWDELDDLDFAATSRSDWTAIRSFRPEYPINFGKPLALVAVKVRATAQLNGMLDNFSVLGRSILPDWTPETQSWQPRATRNPASHFRYVLTGNAIAFPVSVEDMDALEDWHEWCTAKGLTYDRVHDAPSSVLDALKDIAAAGRASPQDKGGRWGVVIDRIMDVVSGHISPRNSWGFSGKRPLARMPDAFRVQFRDMTNDYEQAERVVQLPGFFGEPVVMEALALPGITDPALIYREARRRGYELLHRPDTYEVSQDWEHLAVTRGDLVRLSHDVLNRVQVAARVKTIHGNRVALDTPVTMESGLAYACRFRLADGATVLRSVATQAGQTHILTLTGAGADPATGDLAMFGLASEETYECIVKGVEIGDDLTAKLTLINHAPQIETQADGEVAPAWSGRVGAEAGLSTVAPGVPVIVSVLTGSSLGTEAIAVALRPGSGVVLPASFGIEHRLAGDSEWSTASLVGLSGTAMITGYGASDEVEIRARAISADLVGGDWTDLTTYVVGSSDPSIRDVATASATWTGSVWQYAWTLESAGGGLEEPAGVKVRGGTGLGLGWDDLTDLHAGLLTTSPHELAVPSPAAGDHTFAVCAVLADGTYGTPVLITVHV